LGNKAVCNGLEASNSAAIAEAAKLGRMYSANKCTPAVRDHLHSLAAQEGLFGMLRQTTEPFNHCGYACAVLSGGGCDTEWLRTTPDSLASLMQQLKEEIRGHGETIYGAERLATAPARPLLLQSVVDLLCHDADVAKLTTPQQREQQRLGAAAVAMRAVAATTAGLVTSEATGDAAAAGAAVQDMAAEAQGLAQAAAAAAATAAEGGAEEGGGTDGAGADRQPELGAAAGSGQQEAAAPAAGGAAALQLAAAAAAAAAPGSVLLKGAGLVLLVPNSWASRGRALGGTVTIQGSSYRHYTVAQLMSSDGLLLDSSGPQQRVSVRIAGDFLSSGEQLTGLWSKKAYVLHLQPGAVLLSCQPSHAVKKRFRGDSEAANKGYMALYSSFTDAAISAAVGEAPGLVNCGMPCRNPT
jgi:hypothetical protein